MTKTIFSLACVLTALIVSPMSASAQVSATHAPSANTAPAVVPAESKISVGIEVLENLKIFDLMLRISKQTIMNDEKVPVADRPVIVSYLQEEAALVKGAWSRRVAIECVSPMSDEQLQIMLKLSKTKFMQELMAASVDHSLPQPDFTALSPADQAFIDSEAAANATTLFFSKFSQELLMTDVMQAANKANQRYLAYKQSKS